MRTRTMKNEWIRLTTAGGLLGLAAIASADGTVTGISKQEVGNGVQLKIAGTGLSKPRVLRLLDGEAYIVEFKASLEGRAQSLEVDQAGVKSARVAWYKSKPPVVRVLLRLDPSDKPVLTATHGGYTISVGVKDDAAATAATKTKGAPRTQVDPNFRQPMAVFAPNGSVVPPAAAPQRVSLDFVNTDVVQNLKALALQADVNIVTAPDVQGKKITVSLDKVTVADALDFVTALSGLRYAQVQGSYVVATRDGFAPMMTELGPRSKTQNVIRIVPIICGDAPGVKAALGKWFGPETLEIMIPGETKTVSEKGSSTPADKPATQTAGAGGQTTPPAGAGAAQTPPDTSATKADDSKANDSYATPYIVLIGEAQWDTKAETLAHELDIEMGQAVNLSKLNKRLVKEADQQEQERHQAELNRNRPEQTQATYVVQNGIATDLAKSIQTNAHDSGVTLVSSPAKSTVQTVILSGPEDAVASTMTMLRTLDTGAGASAEIVNYDIKYADPRSLRDDLVANIPGLIVTNPPAAAANPRLYLKGQSVAQSGQTQATAQQTGPGAQGGSTGAAAGGTGGAGVGQTNATEAGVNLPFDNMETSALPMRLILRGSKAQIAEGLAYLSKIDTAPKQIAIEMRVMELTHEDAAKVGLDWSVLTGGAVKTINLNQSQTGIGSNTNPANVVGANFGLNKGSIGVTATLDAIANKNNLISRPNLLAIDGRESEIFVGDDVRYVESIVSSQTGPTIQSADVQVGVRLSVLARCGGDGHITMDLRPVVSFLKGFNSINNSTVTLNLPQTSLRISQSTVNVESGETIAIGGLIQDQDILDIQKVPILGDLPIIGQLFRSTNHDRTRTEVVFFLTVREVTQADRQGAADPRHMEKANKGELPIPKRDWLKS